MLSVSAREQIRMFRKYSMPSPVQVPIKENRSGCFRMSKRDRSHNCGTVTVMRVNLWSEAQFKDYSICLMAKVIRAHVLAPLGMAFRKLGCPVEAEQMQASARRRARQCSCNHCTPTPPPPAHRAKGTTAAAQHFQTSKIAQTTNYLLQSWIFSTVANDLT